MIMDDWRLMTEMPSRLLPLLIKVLFYAFLVQISFKILGILIGLASTVSAKNSLGRINLTPHLLLSKQNSEVAGTLNRIQH